MLRTSARGLTLLEVVISSVILAGIILVSTTVLLTLQKANGNVAANLDLDETARRAFAQLRSELRQSGWNRDITPAAAPVAGTMTDQISAPSFGTTNNLVGGGTLRFKQRISMGDSPTADWSSDITYSLAADGTYRTMAGVTRYKLVRTQAGRPTVDICTNITAMQVIRDPGDYNTLSVEMTLMRENPNWDGPTAPPPIRRTFRERIAVGNLYQ